MAKGSFNGVLSPWSHDHQQAAHRARIAHQERVERAESWLADRMAGQTFWSVESLIEVASRHCETVRGGPLNDDERRVLTSAARNVWCGLAERTKVETKLNESGRIDYLTFTNAA